MIGGGWFPPAALVLALSLFGLEALLTRTAIVPPGGQELLLQWWPYRLFLSAEWRALEFPLWCHNLLGGFPFAAFMHTGSFYPLNLFYYVLDYGTASTCFHLCHLWIQALLMYGFLRESGASKLSSLVLAASSSLTGPFFFRMGVAHDFVTLTWLPGLFWFGWRLEKTNRLLDFGGFSLLIALALLAGNIEILIFALLTLMIFLGAVHRPSPRRSPLLFMAIGLAILLAAYQFLLTAALLPHSYRHFHPAAALNQSVRNLYLIIGLLAFLPSLPGRGEGFFAYLGFALLLGLMIPSRESWLGRTRKTIIILGVPAFLYMINPWPLSALFERLPLIGQFSADDIHYRSLFGVLLLCFLAGAHGLDQLLFAATKKTLGRALIFVLFFLLAQICWLVLGIMNGQGLPPFGISRIILIVALGLALLFQLPAWKKPSAGLRAAPAWLILILLLDVFTMAAAALPRAHRTDLESLDSRIGLPEALTPDRLHLTSPVFDDKVLLRLFRLDRGPGLLVGYIRMGLNPFHETLFRLTSGDPKNDREDYNFFSPNFFLDRNRPLFNYLGVTYVVTRGLPDFNAAGRFRLLVDGPIQVFESPAGLPRYGLYTAVKPWPDNQIAFALFDPQVFHPERELLLPASSAPGPVLSTPRERKDDDVRVVEYRQSQVRLTTNLDSPAYLSIAEPYYPGWRAWVDNQEVRIIRANYAFQAVPLAKPGPHDIILKFLPSEFRLGLWIGITTMLSLVFVFCLRRPQ